MPETKHYVFVLWGDGFDEAVATILVTELRELGLLVKIVGLTPRQISGARGLALVPDLTLDQALPLASQTIGLIVPAISRWHESFNNDPRLHQFFDQAHLNQAVFVIGHWDDDIATSLRLPTLTDDHIIIYPDPEDLVKFARNLANLLSPKTLKDMSH